MNTSTQDTNTQDAIVVRELRKVYDDKAAVDGVSFRVRPGEVFGLLGPNGSGKTTTLETIVGLRTPTAGAVTVLGLDPLQDRQRFTELVAVQPQAANLFPTLTVRETVQLFASFYEEARDPADIIAELDLEDAINVKVKHLSGGQERRLLIGIALIGDPAVLVLDEPSAGLDPSARRKLWDIIERQREKGTTVLLSTHHMDEATQVCDRLAILVNGRIAAEGEPDTLIREHSATATVSFEITAAKSVEEIQALGIEGEITSGSGSVGTAFSIVTEDPDAVIRRLTFTPGLQAFNYRVTRSSLEDVFVEVSNTSEAARL